MQPSYINRPVEGVLNIDILRYNIDILKVVEMVFSKSIFHQEDIIVHYSLRPCMQGNLRPRKTSIYIWLKVKLCACTETTKEAMFVSIFKIIIFYSSYCNYVLTLEWTFLQVLQYLSPESSFFKLFPVVLN